jgi:hypothetical protein
MTAPIIPHPYPRPAIELADILRTYLPAYLKDHKLPVHYHKVLRAIMNCRTAALDAHAAQCDECGTIEISYNSCRNRHCPKCQGSAKLRWLGLRVEELLPGPYYHGVFTLPHVLNLLLYFNQKILYDLLFHAAFAALNDFAANPKWLGARLGTIAILHTWGQDLKFHVHLHLIVMGGGLSADGASWITPRYEDNDFLFPVPALSEVFRGKFIEALEELLNRNELELPGELSDLRHPVVFEDFKRKLHNEKWVVYAKPPFGGPEQVLSYIGRYTHRVAISNHRLKGMADGMITFEYIDYKDGHTTKEMTLPVDEFIRRLLRHIVPPRFVRIRYSGIFAGSKRKKNLAMAKDLIIAGIEKAAETMKRLKDHALALFEAARRKCRTCKEGTMEFIELLRWHPVEQCFLGQTIRGTPSKFG